MALVVCSSCGKKTGEGIFCEKCGAELVADEPANAPNETVDNQLTTHHPPKIQADECSGMETVGGGLTVDTVVQPRPPAPVPPPVMNPSCSFINVEHDQSRVFVVGQTMNFRFALMPLVDGLSEVFIAAVFEGRKKKVEVQRLHWIPCRGERRELKNINFAAPEAGSVGFTFYFGFTKDGVEYVFEADGEHKVWPSHAHAQEVVRNIEINIQNSGHAADFDLAGIRDGLSTGDSLEEVIDRLHRMPPLWSALRLYRSSWTPPRVANRETRQLMPVPLRTQPPYAARTNRLTLCVGERKIHLLSAPLIRLGKNRQNDIVTRIFEDGRAISELNSKISRYHCIIERHDKTCYVIDRGDYPGEGSRPSAFGVFLNGEQISPNDRIKLDSKNTAQLTLAGPSPETPGAFALEIEPWPVPESVRTGWWDNAKRKPGSLVMRRSDCIPETYIALWDCLLLRDADPDFEGLIVWREDTGFGYASADSEGWLEPGTTIRTANTEIRVEEWNQFGL